MTTLALVSNINALKYAEKLKFPNNKSLALIITFNLEHWDMTKDTDEPYYAGGPPVIPDSLPGRVLDVPNFRID